MLVQCPWGLKTKSKLGLISQGFIKPDYISWVYSDSEFNLTAGILSVSESVVGVVKVLTRLFFAAFVHTVSLLVHVDGF